MKFHLLLLDDCLDLRMFVMDDLQQIFSESLRACDLLFVWAANVPSLVRAGRFIKTGTRT